MVPCELCKSLLGRPGYVPPHPRLIRTGDAISGTGAQAFLYTCQRCTQVIALAHDDGADYWTGHEEQWGDGVTG
jgi:hypothetical protein